VRNPKDKPAGCCEISVPQDSPVELRSPLSASTHTHTPESQNCSTWSNLSASSPTKLGECRRILGSVSRGTPPPCRRGLSSQSSKKDKMRSHHLAFALAPSSSRAPSLSSKRSLARSHLPQLAHAEESILSRKAAPVEIQGRPFSHLSPQRKQARQLEFQEKSPGKRDREDPSFERQSSSGRRFIEYIKRFRYINLLLPTHWRVRFVAT